MPKFSLPTNHWESFGAWLRQKRREADLTQAQVAKRAKIHEVQVARIEKGESGTKRETVAELARAIGINTEEALNRAGYALLESNGENKSDQMQPKNFAEFLKALEDLGLEQLQFSLLGIRDLDQYTQDELDDLLKRIKEDVEISIWRKQR